MTDTNQQKSRPERRRWLTGVALAATFVAGGVVMPLIAAKAQDAGMQAMMGGPGHAGMHAMMMAHIQSMLDRVGATDSQKSRIEAILHAGFASMGGMHADMSQTHAQLHALLTASTIDRNALEQLRASRIAEIDQASRKIVQAMADAAEVLSPEQRAKLAGLMRESHPPS